MKQIERGSRAAIRAGGLSLGFVVGAAGLGASAAQAADYQLASHLLVEGGKAFPGGPLADWLTPGPSLRVGLFGGARVPKIQWLGAIGLGVDFTYSTHGSKLGDTGFKYHRFEWDWLFVPVTLYDFIVLTPGLAWVVTDVNDPVQDIEQTSIRPAGVIGLGIHYPVINHLSVCVDGRAEIAFADRERTRSGGRRNITGSFYTWFAGLKLWF